jgi:hypothetical protein
MHESGVAELAFAPGSIQGRRLAVSGKVIPSGFGFEKELSKP